MNNCAEITLQQHVGVDLGTMPVTVAALVYCRPTSVSQLIALTGHII